MLSTSSLMSRTLAASSSKPMHTSQIPLTRRRLQPEQIQALQTLYELKSHPSKEERAALARELNLEMKAVNVWYQNKRRSMKKKSLAWNRAVSENDTLRSRSAPQTTQSKSAHRSLLRSCSLDTIVESRQLRDSRSSSSRPPLSRRAHTPNRQYDLAPASAPSGNHDIEIWEHIPSSPTLPPSSPSEDCLRFAVLPPRSKVLRSLEFACAKERSAWRRRLPDEEEEDRDVPQMDLDAISGLDGDDTEPEVDEVLTPEVSMDTFPDFSQRPTLPNDGSPRQLRRPGMEVQEKGAVFPAEDVEAAMALLGFSVHKL